MSQRDGYEHGVPSWIAGAHPDPERRRASTRELFGWEADTARRPPRLHARAAATSPGFVDGRRRRLAHAHLGRQRRRDRRRAAAAGGSVVTSRSTSPASAARPCSPTPPAPCSACSSPSAHRGAQVVNEPGAWAMSALAHARPRGRQRLLRRRLRLGDRHVRRRRHRGHAVAPAGLRGRRAGAAGAARPRRRRPARRRRRGWAVDFWVDDVDATAERAARARRLRARTGRRTCPSAAPPSSPTRRARRSRSAGWCRHEHDRGRQPRHARRRHAGAGPPRRGPPRRLRARRLGHALLRRGPGRVHGRADEPRRRRAAVRPLDLREVRPTPGRSSRRTTRSGRCSRRSTKYVVSRSDRRSSSGRTP